MGNRWIDANLGYVALDAVVVVAGAITFKGAPLHFHLVGRLKCAGDHLPHPAHRLGVAGNY